MSSRQGRVSILHFWARTINPRLSLRVRLGIAIAGIALILSIVETWSVGQTTSLMLQTDIGQSLAELGIQMTDKLDRGMFERYRDIQIAATLDTIRNPNTSISSKRQLLEQLQSTYPDYAWIGLINPQGQVLAATGGLLEGKDISKRPVFQGGLKAPYVGDVHEAMLLSKLLPNPIGEPLRFVDVSTPITDNTGKVLGVLAAHLSWEWAKEVQNSLLQPLWQQRQVEMLILSNNGTVLLGKPNLQGQNLHLNSVQAASQGRNGYIVETWADGNTYLTGFARSTGYRNYPGLGWIVLVRQRTDVAFIPVRQLQEQIFLRNSILAVFFAILGWWLAGQFTDKLLTIAQAADRIRRGETKVKIPLVSGVDEVAMLSASLNNLVQTLTEQENELRQELIQRQKIEAEREQLLVREQEARAQAEAANRMKDDFLAILSHELRTPLVPIQGWTQLLRRGKLNPETTAEALETIDRNTNLLATLVKDVLDVSRIITGKLRLDVSKVNLVGVIPSAIATISSASEAKNIHIAFFCDLLAVKVLGDANRLQQIVWNLVSNAVKFTPAGGQVEVRLSTSPDSTSKPLHTPSEAIITVTDTGIGIPPEFLPYVFDRFRQADGTITRQHGGLGLGLAIVRHLVELHGGTVCVESKGIGQGSTFTVKLPLLDCSAQTISELSTSTSAISFPPSTLALTGLQVLVVEDEPDARQFLKLALTQYGAEVITVASATEAISALLEFQPHVLVSDIAMPQEDGYSLIRKIRGLDSMQGRKIPAVALTAHATAESRKQALLAGFQLYVAKPVYPDELAVVVANLAGRT